MEVSISQQNLENIRRKVASGEYSSPDEVIAFALALLDERGRALERDLVDTKRKVRLGLDQADAGQLIPADRVFRELRQRNAEAAQNCP